MHISYTRSPEGAIIGLRFVADQTVAAREAVAYLMFNDSENWRRMRRDETRSRGLIRGFLHLLRQSLFAIPRTLADLAREPSRRSRLPAVEEDRVPVHLLAFGADFDAGTARASRDDTDETYDFVLRRERA